MYSLMPILIISYGLQYLDSTPLSPYVHRIIAYDRRSPTAETSLSYSAILGIQADLVPGTQILT
jgi:hypothetical protein